MRVEVNARDVRIKIRRGKEDKGTRPGKKVTGTGRHLHYALPVTNALGIHQPRESLSNSYAARNFFGTNTKCDAYSLRKDAIGKRNRKKKKDGNEGEMRVQETEKERKRESGVLPARW